MPSRRQDPDQARALARLRRFAKLLDASVGIPGTRWKLGIDSIVGLIPGAGDLIGLGLSLFVVHRARRLGASRRALLEMLANVVLESVVGIVPVLGDAFDIWFQSNRRNVVLLEKELAQRRREEAREEVGA